MTESVISAASEELPTDARDSDIFIVVLLNSALLPVPPKPEKPFAKRKVPLLNETVLLEFVVFMLLLTVICAPLAEFRAKTAFPLRFTVLSNAASALIV